MKIGFPVEMGTFHGSQELQPGIYGAFPYGAQRAFKRSSVICPYCRGAMQEFNPGPHVRAGRVVHAVDENVALYELAPPGQRILKCNRCEQVFTLPKENV